MMQDVATAKSEVAAFAAKTEAQNFTDPGGKEQFGLFLQDQEAQSVTKKPAQADPAVKVTQPHKNESPKHNDGNNQTAKIAKHEENSENQERNGSPDEVANRLSEEGDKKVAVEVNASSNANVNAEKSDVNFAHTKAELTLDLTGKDIEDTSTASTDAIVSEEWVLLVDALQKLAIDSAETAPKVQTDAADSANSIKVLEDSVAGEQNLENHDIKSARIELVEQPLVDEAEIDENALLDPQGVNSKNSIEDSQEAKLKSALELLVQQALKDVRAVEGETLTTATSKAIEIILDKPQVLQQVLDKMANLEVATNKPNKVSDADKVSPAVSSNSPSPISVEPKIDLSLHENKALLSALLIDSSKKEPDVVTSVLAPVLKSSTPLSNQVNPALEPLSPNALNTAKLVNKDTPSTEFQINLVATEQGLNIPTIMPNSKKNDMNLLLNLPDTKLDKVLENIAQRVLEQGTKDNGGGTERLTPDAGAQQVIHPKMANITLPVETTNRDFVSQLKSGLEEFKQQVAQGREPGIDLKALISEALTKTADASLVPKAVNIDKILTNVSQVMDVAHTISRSFEHHQEQSVNLAHRDVAQIQGEQSKQIQLNQFESKLDKAINITKPEGHQQLAEKVRWMVNTRNLVADIRLDPAELGSVQVRVAVSGESATVNFVVQSQLARDAVDTATPRLREMLAEKGIELGQSSVRQENQGQQDKNGDQLARQQQPNNENIDSLDAPDQLVAQQNVVNGSLGGIDYFV